MPPKKNSEGTPYFPNLGDVKSKKPRHVAYAGKVWTRNKAQLITRYLQKFLFVTRGAQYIDLFAGPQNDDDREESWAAKLVLEGCPADRLRRVYLFELDPDSVERLRGLRKKHHRGWRLLSTRKVEVVEGDSNQTVPAYFGPGRHCLKQTLPAFCLLDQRTRECDWETVRFVSGLKTKGCKVELFYFLVQGWADRHWHLMDREGETKGRILKWWGRPDWETFRDATSFERGELVAERFRSELGYDFAQAFPIFEQGNSGRVFFYMVHGSDDPRALPLMGKSYKEIGMNLPNEDSDQADLEGFWQEGPAVPHPDDQEAAE